MKKVFSKIRKNAMELAVDVSKRDYKGITEEDLDILAEAIEILNDMYETLYDEVFVEVEEGSKTLCKGTKDQL
jgi:hypothetical protein